MIIDLYLKLKPKRKTAKNVVKFSNLKSNCHEASTKVVETCSVQIGSCDLAPSGSSNPLFDPNLTSDNGIFSDPHPELLH